MTAETDLLPSSVAAFTEALKGGRGSLDAWLEVNDEREVAAHVEAYARANVAVATATLQAEVEALRAEVTALQREIGSLHMHAKQRAMGSHQSAAPLQPHNDSAAPDFCRWIFDDNEFAPVWNGSCGVAWIFIDGGPEENDLRYCPKCGKPCLFEKPQHDNDGTPLPHQP